MSKVIYYLSLFDAALRYSPVAAISFGAAAIFGGFIFINYFREYERSTKAEDKSRMIWITVLFAIVVISSIVLFTGIPR